MLKDQKFRAMAGNTQMFLFLLVNLIGALVLLSFIDIGLAAFLALGVLLGAPMTIFYQSSFFSKPKH